jgi:hypothetical protein
VQIPESFPQKYLIEKYITECYIKFNEKVNDKTFFKMGSQAENVNLLIP